VGSQLINCQPKNGFQVQVLVGFGLPAAIGAKVGNPKQDVVCISGDSSIQMSIQELGTIAQYRLGIRLLLLIMDGKEWYVNGKNPLWK
jgi:thiamine pyrophosphate-dependent acetolactate synthase large subunit-like protein